MKYCEMEMGIEYSRSKWRSEPLTPHMEPPAHHLIFERSKSWENVSCF